MSQTISTFCEIPSLKLKLTVLKTTTPIALL